MAGVSLEAVGKSYGDSKVLHDIDLEIEDGAFTVIVGPSGCGKSTLLRIIAGLESADRGHVRIGGDVANATPPAKRGVAMVFQSYALYPHMTAFQNMAFGLKLAKTSRVEIDARVRAAADTLAVSHLLNRKPRELSGGERQRIAIGRAIVRQPRVFLFDEPLSNLDAELRVRMRYEFARLHRLLKATMIYVTHDQVEAMTIADRIVVLCAGSVEQTGPPMEIYRNPANRFVAGFIGSPRMNFLPGKLQSAAADEALVRLDSGETVAVAAPAAGRARPGDVVTVGVRPEHLSQDEGRNRLKATSQLVEALGSSSVAYWSRPGTEDLLISLSFGELKCDPGLQTHLCFAPDRCHLFDARGVTLNRTRRS